jgi:hypothetical protein
VCQRYRQEQHQRGQRQQDVADLNRPRAGEAAHAQAEEADDEHRVLQVGEYPNLGADPADQHQLQEQPQQADQEDGQHAIGRAGRGGGVVRVGGHGFLGKNRDEGTKKRRSRRAVGSVIPVIAVVSFVGCMSLRQRTKCTKARCVTQ